MNILVGVSGGVDSACVLNILKAQGHSVVGAMMKIYDGEIKTIANSCYGTDKKKEINDAIAVCNAADVPFYLVDLSKEFNEIVFSEFKNLYLNGLTPNPCVMCNKFIKFGLFPKAAKKMGLRFEKFATGHYARNELNPCTLRYELKKGINPKKDQTYFLYKLSQDELKNILFPLGGYEKEQVRKYALENNIECQLSLEEKMGCGLGVCLGCAVKTAQSPKDAPEYFHVCKGGPVFNAKDVEI